MRSQLRKFTLTKMRKALKQLLAGDQSEHSVPQELQLLVVADLVLAVAGLLRFLFSCLRAVSDRLLNYRPPPEVITQPLFQRRDFAFLHKVGGLAKAETEQM